MRPGTAIALAAAAVASVPIAFGTGRASAQTYIGQNFTLSRTDTDLLRPDLCGAAGANYFVELSGGHYGVYRKSDGALVRTSNMEAFWANAGAPTSGVRIADPRVVYDPYAKRWYASAIDTNVLPPAAPSAKPMSPLRRPARSSRA